MRVALFDFDGTLYANETFPILMDHLKNHPIYHAKYNRFLRSILLPYIGSKLKIYPEAKMREHSMQIYLSALDQLSKQELDTYFEEIADKMRPNFNQQVMARLEQHINNHDHVILISGAYTPLFQSAAKGLRFDTIIGTDIPLQAQHVDSKSPIYHVQASRKRMKINTALANKEIDWSNSFAYADSYADLPVFELVGNPVAVRPEPQLKSVAEASGWEII
ncbi:HAD-IB family hydrolase [Virgibacillus sp. NKC19-3]|uniref:HAD family hydrolase n=1 Tax=Virgibacillus saliphilus TaxID=2831674 RepID=UPI001C9A72FD|nr:HAD-IB family hydrolase [Virgibacillus sp. NKC19-3]MBY7142503.1 HAD-IB family hydrolase [Virgibacillus sp. NKC19-3]